MELDARQQRTRAQLHAAVLDLAERTPAGSITVTALAERAGIHRSTVYEHAASPSALLQQALRAELDALRDEHLRDVPAGETAQALRRVTRGVIEHVDRHAAIYRRLDDAHESSLHAFLSEHFQESSRLLVARTDLVIPFGVPGLDDATVTAATVRFVADGVVGVLAVWVALPEPRDIDAALTLLAELLPAWWPRAA
jgi:AcrR family transcriptional regulator